MFVVGVTGGIGCGKTAVTDYLTKKGVTIADADQASRVVVEPGRPALQSIADHFGQYLIQDDGNLNRRALRDIIFNDSNEKVWLEQLLHPLINDQLRTELQQTTASAYSVLVSPLLFETKQHTMTNRVLVIDVAENVQIERTMTRDNISREQAKAIIHSQASRKERQNMADDLVDNSGSIEQLHQQLDGLHNMYIKLSRR